MYLLCRLLNLGMLILVCSYLSYFISKVSLSDQFTCHLHTGVLFNRSVPVTCKLVVVDVFYVFSTVYLVVLLAAFSYTQLKSNFTCGCDGLSMFPGGEPVRAEQLQISAGVYELSMEGKRRRRRARSATSRNTSAQIKPGNVPAAAGPSP
ncbi:hypothetical protein AMELA_G00257840 [Ameiurus melas]|uniref:Uncharacterized protein n=1 Tax=Ameiurus melas TaxID=219545 RepID=A0A7J5ZS64_AMEME|nr:hypothetical protein AMELA_G00257840 [Ameiurus melas]